MKERFNAAADGRATWKRENLPDPKDVADAGITTRESLNWQAAQHPQEPAPRYEIDQPHIRHAVQAAEQNKRAQEQRIREENFRQRPEKARQDFGTARDYRGTEHER